MNLADTIREMGMEFVAGGPGSGRHKDYDKMRRALKGSDFSHSWQHPSKANVQIFSDRPKGEGNASQVHVNKKTSNFDHMVTDEQGKDMFAPGDLGGGKGIRELKEDI